MAVPFIAACLNERANGTIHFGVPPVGPENSVQGTIVGIPVDKKRIIRRFYSALKCSFYDEDFESVCKCVCQPQFIPVIGSKDSKENLFVVEIDVNPSTNFTGDDVFFTRHKTEDDRNTKLMFYRLKHDSKEPILGTSEDIVNYIAIKSKLTQERKIQEEKTLDNKVNENLRQKFLDLFSAGFETIKEELHPVLLLSPLESNLGEEYVAKNFQF